MITHLALIMDGNRRWAKKRNLFPWLGHKQGLHTVEMAVRYCLDNNIAYLSLYLFSLENFKRSQDEVSYLFSLLHDSLDRISELVKEGVKIRFVGDVSAMPESVYETCKKIEERTGSGSRLLCNFLFCYGSQQEIIAGVNKALRENQAEVTIESFKNILWFGDIPNPDVVIRTGGVKRLSNFLLFQLAYAEIRFLDCLWPDLTRTLLDETVLDCYGAQKNLGK